MVEAAKGEREKEKEERKAKKEGCCEMGPQRKE